VLHETSTADDVLAFPLELRYIRSSSEHS